MFFYHDFIKQFRAQAVQKGQNETLILENLHHLFITLIAMLASYSFD
jgi:hypothetical protein